MSMFLTGIRLVILISAVVLAAASLGLCIAYAQQHPEMVSQMAEHGSDIRSLGARIAALEAERLATRVAVLEADMHLLFSISSLAAGGVITLSVGLIMQMFIRKDKEKQQL